MKRIFVILSILFTTNCFGAELLVKSKPHWMDDLTQTEVNKMTPEQKQSYEARSQESDIIVVRPDGFLLDDNNKANGRDECLPKYIIFKLEGVSYDEVKFLEDSLTEEIDNPISPQKKITRMLKHRKYCIPTLVLNNAKQLNKSVIIIPKAQAQAFIANIIQKTE